MQAYILITADAGKAINALDSVKKVEGVKSAYMTVGPYDIIAFVEAPDTSSLTSMIVDKIQKVDGVSRTLTCIAVG